MTRQHGGYSEAELDEVLGRSAPDSRQGKMAFLGEIDAEPELPKGQAPADGETPPKAPPIEATTSLKADAVARRFSGKLNKFKKTLAEKFPKVLNKAITDKGPEWQLDAEESAMLAESVENCFEILDIDFRIKPITTVLENPLWVLVLPAVVLLLIFGTKSIALARPKEETAPPAEGVTTDDKTTGETEPTKGVVFN